MNKYLLNIKLTDILGDSNYLPESNKILNQLEKIFTGLYVSKDISTNFIRFFKKENGKDVTYMLNILYKKKMFVSVRKVYGQLNCDITVSEASEIITYFTIKCIRNNKIMIADNSSPINIEEIMPASPNSKIGNSL